MVLNMLLKVFKACVQDVVQTDLLQEVRSDDLVEEVAEEAPRAGPLARKMWKCARLGVRSEEVWSRFAQRVLMMGSLATAGDVSLIFRAFGMIKYRDLKARFLGPRLKEHKLNG